MVTIDGRFNGPPHSANGGYACGIAALAFTVGPAAVRLRAAPPLGEPMQVVRADGERRLEHEGVVVATVREWDGDFEVPPAPSAEELDAAVAAFDVDDYRHHHAFERCFTCGPAREEGDGLRLFPAPLARDRVAWPWVPPATMSSDGELVDVPIVWAALDCPSGLAWINAPGEPLPGPAVLGQLAVRIDRRPAVGESLIVGGWQVAADGRKRHAGSAVWSPEGEVLARGAATWIVLDADQAQAFGARPV